jgi:hypothetical protein
VVWQPAGFERAGVSNPVRRARLSAVKSCERLMLPLLGGDDMVDGADRDDLGTLEIRLADDIAAHQLAAFLAVTEEVYFDSLWLRRAEEASGGFFPDEYSPSNAEELWINRFETAKYSSPTKA